MKKNYATILRTAFLSLSLLMLSAITYAQDKIVIDKDQAESWFVRNWYWVAGAVLLLLIIGLGGSSSRRRRKTTTVVKDNYGNVKSVTSTEVVD